MNKKIIAITAFFIFSLTAVQAHEDEKSTKDTAQNKEKQQVEQSELNNIKNQGEKNNTSLFAPFSEFPNLHPMIVHFPVVLLLVAFLSQLAALFLFKKELGWVTLFILLGAFIGALFASQVFHPHAHDLAPKAQKVLEAHESFATWTVWLSAFALLLKAISIFFVKQNKWIEILVFLIITGSALTVTLAGHLGSQLVFIEEVGPDNNNLEQENHEH